MPSAVLVGLPERHPLVPAEIHEKVVKALADCKKSFADAGIPYACLFAAPEEGESGEATMSPVKFSQDAQQHSAPCRRSSDSQLRGCSDAAL